MKLFSDSWDCIATLGSHNSWVYGVPIAPDNNTLASISFNQILVWDLTTKEVIQNIDGHSAIVLSLSISPDGKILASGSADKTVKTWDLKTGKLLHTFAVRKDPIHSVALSPDGKILASGGERKYKTEQGKTTTIYLWNPINGELLRTISGHSLRVKKLVFSPDGKILASVGNESVVKLWNPHTGELVNTLNIEAFDIAITPDSKHLISSGQYGVKIWNLTNGELVQQLSENSDFIRCIAIHPNKQLLAVGCHTNMEIWNLNTKQRLQILDCLHPISLFFSPDGKLLSSGDATCFEGGQGVKVWRVPADLDEVPEFDVISASSDTPKLDEIQEQLAVEEFFNPANIKDAREKILTSIVRRQGQSRFRKKLLQAYMGRCCITGCDVEAVLEAAHIIPYQGTDTNHVANGLLLRTDIHTLFDLHIISINPDTKEVVIASSLIDTQYSDLEGKKLCIPQDLASQPSTDALSNHYNRFLTQQ